jgi:hypothetical protein
MPSNETDGFGILAHLLESVKPLGTPRSNNASAVAVPGIARGHERKQAMENFDMFGTFKWLCFHTCHHAPNSIRHVISCNFHKHKSLSWNA